MERELEILGHGIRPGTMLVFSPYATPRSSRFWADPLIFRPDRWLDDAAPARGAYVPFGGGSHRCLGETMATTELTVMLARLLARSTLTAVPQRVRAVGISSMRPRDGVRIRLDA